MIPHIVQEYERLSSNVDSIKEFLEINPDDLEHSMTTQASNYGWLAMHAAAARGQLSAAKAEVDSIKGALFAEYKLNMTAADAKAPTDEMTKSLVISDQRVITARENLSLAEMRDMYWQTVLRAIDQRGFFLRDLYTKSFKDQCNEAMFPARMREYTDELSEIAEEAANPEVTKEQRNRRVQQRRAENAMKTAQRIFGTNQKGEK